MVRLHKGIVAAIVAVVVVAVPAVTLGLAAAPTTPTVQAGAAEAATTAPAAPKPLPKPVSAAATASAAATRTYDLDFTLPTAGKSGCLVCHGDPNLAKIGVETTSSIYVDVARLQKSAHAEDTPCTGCHLDFAYTSPHKQIEGGDDWAAAAKLACKNCHKDAFSAYANGMHSPAGKPGQTPDETVKARVAAGKPANVPLCGDCHGGHTIPSMDDTPAMTAQHLTGYDMCGTCHIEAAASYSDYYHGAAYRRGSLDAPSCWDCHGYHEILAVDDRRSPVHPSRLAETCGQAGCHDNVDEQFLEYAKLIHGHDALRDANPVFSLTRDTIGRAVETLRSLL